MFKFSKLCILLFVLTLFLSSCQELQYIQREENAEAMSIENLFNNSYQESKVEVIRPEQELSLSFRSSNVSSVACVYNGTLYYTSVGGWGILRYIDPKTGFSEILCKDPLCPHAGDKALCLANEWFFEMWNIVTDGEHLYVYAAKDKGMYDNFQNSWKVKKHGIYEIDLKNNTFHVITEWNSLDGRLIPTLGLQGDYLYYSRRTNAENNYNTLYRIKKSGNGREEQLSNGNMEFNYFIIQGDTLYYTSVDSVLYKSNLSMTNPQKIVENVTYFTIEDNYIYIGHEIYTSSKGNYKGGRNSTPKSEIRRINLSDFNDIEYICTTSSGLPIFDGEVYYYLPYEPVDMKAYMDDAEYDVLNDNNGKIIIADIKTNEIIKIYQDDKYCGFKLLYADKDTLLIAAGDVESEEVLNRIGISNGSDIEYYETYEKFKGTYSLYN